MVGGRATGVELRRGVPRDEEREPRVALGRLEPGAPPAELGTIRPRPGAGLDRESETPGDRVDVVRRQADRVPTVAVGGEVQHGPSEHRPGRLLSIDDPDQLDVVVAERHDPVRGPPVRVPSAGIETRPWSRSSRSPASSRSRTASTTWSITSTVRPLLRGILPSIVTEVTELRSALPYARTYVRGCGMSELRSAVESLRAEVLPDLPDARIEEDFSELQRVAELLEIERLRRLAELDRRRVFERDGHLSAASWLASTHKVPGEPRATRAHRTRARGDAGDPASARRRRSVDVGRPCARHGSRRRP